MVEDGDLSAVADKQGFAGVEDEASIEGPDEVLGKHFANVED